MSQSADKFENDQSTGSIKKLLQPVIKFYLTYSTGYKQCTTTYSDMWSMKVSLRDQIRARSQPEKQRRVQDILREL